MVVASPIAEPALSCSGVMPSMVLSCSAAAAMSSQLVGCQSAGRPACWKSFLLKKMTRPSVPAGTPYRSSWKDDVALDGSWICAQPSQLS